MSASNWYRDVSEDQMKAGRIARKAEYAKGLLNFPPNQKNPQHWKTMNPQKQGDCQNFKWDLWKC